MPSCLILYIIWNVSPEIIILNLFGTTLPITWYGLFFALSFVTGQQLGLYIFRQDGKPAADVERLTIYVVVGTVVGARLGHFLFYEWEQLFMHPWQWLTTLITPPFQGLASHGAIIGILFSLFWYSRKKPDQSFLWVIDRVVIAGSFSFWIRLGNLFNSEIYGKPTTLPWGFVFVREVDPALLPVVPRHPTQLYEALFCLFLLGLTFSLWKFRRHRLPAGFIAGIFIILLFSFRFLVEFLKNNQAGFEGGMDLNMGQVLSIPAILVGTAILIFSRKTVTNPESDYASQISGSW